MIHNHIFRIGSVEIVANELTVFGVLMLVGGERKYKVRAIKLLREKFCIGLYEAKRFVDFMEEHCALDADTGEVLVRDIRPVVSYERAPCEY